MTIEEKAFERKRFVFEKLLEYGFKKVGNDFVFDADFMNGDFHAVISVSESGIISGKVIDVMNDEEYTQLRIENMNGAYIGKVRAEYLDLLSNIAESCCDDVLFSFDQANRITDMIFDKFDILPDFPWQKSNFQSYGVFRHQDSRKWFALIMNIKWKSILKNKNDKNVDVINLKINPDDSDKLKKIEGIYPGHHMNHKNWITVALDDTLPDEEIMKLIDTSFELT